jgi:hypothetical protein
MLLMSIRHREGATMMGILGQGIPHQTFRHFAECDERLRRSVAAFATRAAAIQAVAGEAMARLSASVDDALARLEVTPR